MAKDSDGGWGTEPSLGVGVGNSTPTMSMTTPIGRRTQTPASLGPHLGQRPDENVIAHHQGYAQRDIGGHHGLRVDGQRRCIHPAPRDHEDKGDDEGPQNRAVQQREANRR